MTKNRSFVSRARGKAQDDKTSRARGKARDDKTSGARGRLRKTGHILYRFVILTQPA